MTVTTARSFFTPEDLLALPDAVNYELVDGQLVERKMGTRSSMIGTAIASILRNFVRARQRGHVAGADCGYQCFPDAPDKVRKPDVSFVARGRFPNDEPPDGHAKIDRDLAVEVISPDDLAGGSTRSSRSTWPPA